jgi:glycosyltransferase involved in cell wall biosynthesis
MLIVGIDASNLRTGGGITHLIGFLGAAEPAEFGIRKIIVWGGRNTLERLPARPWLDSYHDQLLDRSLPFRVFWQQRVLPSLCRRVDLLFSPGGSAPRSVHPVVVMHRNMLPFDWAELRRYQVSLTSLRLLILRRQQIASFRHADGVIFLTRHAEQSIRRIARISAPSRVIAHGLDETWLDNPRPRRRLSELKSSDPITVLYVSTVDVYKHQWNVAHAAAQLRNDGIPLVVRFVGASYPPALRRLQSALRHEDPSGSFLNYEGPRKQKDLQADYARADIAVFASTCEALPNVLIEAMGAALPIASSCRPPMPEILQDGGVYFEPESISSIASALRRLIEAPALQESLAARSSELAKKFSWKRCASETLEFLAAIGKTRGADRSFSASPAGRAQERDSPRSASHPPASDTGQNVATSGLTKSVDLSDASVNKEMVSA